MSQDQQWEIRIVKKTYDKGTPAEFSWYYVCETYEENIDLRPMMIEGASQEEIRSILMNAIKAIDKPLIELEKNTEILF